jgi:hypothetical protein
VAQFEADHWPSSSLSAWVTYPFSINVNCDGRMRRCHYPTFGKDDHQFRSKLVTLVNIGAISIDNPCASFAREAGAMSEVAKRIMFNVTGEFPKLEVMLFAEMLKRIRSLDVVWDLTIMSHGKGRKGHEVDRAVEVVIYRDEQGNHEDAVHTLTAFLKSNKLQYRLLGDVAG